jgi:hypothetical protein
VEEEGFKKRAERRQASWAATLASEILSEVPVAQTFVGQATQAAWGRISLSWGHLDHSVRRERSQGDRYKKYSHEDETDKQLSGHSHGPRRCGSELGIDERRAWKDGSSEDA